MDRIELSSSALAQPNSPGGAHPENSVQLVEQFFNRIHLLPADCRRAFIASQAEKSSLLGRIKVDRNAGAPLLGLPYLIQDLFDVLGLPTQCGAPFEEPFQGLMEENCLLAQTLAGHGSRCVAKGVPSEFGVDIRGLNRHFGNCPHAYEPHLVCGGGAGSSAHAVAAEWVPLAFGLDTCAGIRIPAAFHGLFGFRMEHNSYARKGVFPIVPSLESVGWVTKTPANLLKVFNCFYPESGTGERSSHGLLLGDAFQCCSTESKSGLLQRVRPLDLDENPTITRRLSHLFERAASAFQIIRNRELYAVHRYWIEEYGCAYDPRLLSLFEAGRTCSAVRSEEASTIQQNLRATLVDLFREYDYLVLPVSPIPSPEIAEWEGTLEEDIHILNAPLSLSFLPALIVPYSCGQKFNAAQFIFNPKKLHLASELLKTLSVGLTESE